MIEFIRLAILTKWPIYPILTLFLFYVMIYG